MPQPPPIREPSLEFSCHPSSGPTPELPPAPGLGFAEFEALLDMNWLTFRTSIIHEHQRALNSGFGPAEAEPQLPHGLTLAGENKCSVHGPDDGPAVKLSFADPDGADVEITAALADAEKTPCEILETGEEGTNTYTTSRLNDSLVLSSSLSVPINERWELIVFMLLESFERSSQSVLHRDWVTAFQAVASTTKSPYRIKNTLNHSTDCRMSSLDRGSVSVFRGSVFRDPAAVFRGSVFTHRQGFESMVVIGPSSKTSLAWLSLVLVFISYEVIWAPLELAFGYRFEEPSLLVFSSLMFWSLDILVNFLTGVYVKGVLRMKLAEIAMHYVRTWFSLDFGILLLEYAQFVLSDSNGNGISMVRFIKFSKLSHLFRVLKLNRVAEQLQYAIPETVWVLLLVVKLSLVYLIGFHISACCWIRLQSTASSGSLTEDERPDLLQAYLYSVHDMLGFFLGSTVTSTKGHEGYVFAIMCRFVGFLASSIYLANIVWILRLLDKKTYRKLQISCDGFLRRHHISRDLQLRVKRAFVSSWKYTQLQDRMKEQEAFLKCLPKSLYMDICRDAYGRLICKCIFLLDLFSVYHKIGRLVCFEALFELVVQRHDVLFTQGYESKSMYVITSGKMRYTLSQATKNKSDLFHAIRTGDQVYGHGGALCEPSLWTKWKHVGKSLMETDSVVLALDADQFREIVKRFTEALVICVQYGNKFMHYFKDNVTNIDDASQINLDWHDLDDWTFQKNQGHAMFLSHFKEEAGSDAALLHSDLLRLINNDISSPMHDYENPFFLDSENLRDLNMLKNYVVQSKNILFLLSPGVLSRPWCLIELVTAVRQSVNVVPILIERPGIRFTFPDDDFYMTFRNGTYLNSQASELLAANDIKLDDAANAIRHVFTKIAVKFSPHKSASVRLSEVNELVQACNFSAKFTRSGAMRFSQQQGSSTSLPKPTDMTADSTATDNCMVDSIDTASYQQ